MHPSAPIFLNGVGGAWEVTEMALEGPEIKYLNI